MRPVYVPVQVRPGLVGPAIATDADGHPHAVTAGRVDLVDGRLCMVALWLQEEGGRHLVRFRDESECWVLPCPAWRYEPDDGPRPTARAADRPLEVTVRPGGRLRLLTEETRR